MKLEPTGPYQIVRAADLPEANPEQRWLIQDLWLNEAGGMIGASPKRCKTWLALDMAVSVASGTPCLGQFDVGRNGRVLLYCAEDDLGTLKSRVRSICESRGLSLEDLDIAFITEARIDLNNPFHFLRLENAVKTYAPLLLVLDPFVRIFSGNEDDSSQVSRVLGLLRKLQRDHHVAVAVVHHNSKRSEGGGQALRGSGDFYAWMDSGIFLRRTDSGLIRLSAEHRSAATPDPIHIRLVVEGHAHLEVVEHDDSVAEDVARDIKGDVLAALQAAGGPLGRTDLRKALKMNNKRLGDALVGMAASGAIVADGKKWALPESSVPPAAPREDAERNGQLQ